MALNRQSNIRGTVVGDPLTKGEQSTAIGTHYDEQGIGGYMVVDNLAQRNALPTRTDSKLNDDGASSGQRKRGMLVKTLGDGNGKVWELVVPNWDTLTTEAARVSALANNANWTEANFGGGGGNGSSWLIQPFLVDEVIDVPPDSHFIIRNPTIGANGTINLGAGAELYLL